MSAMKIDWKEVFLLGAKLSEATDHLNDAIRRIEAELVSSRIGVTVEVLMLLKTEGVNALPVGRFYLAWQKWHAQWSLVVHTEVFAKVSGEDDFLRTNSEPLLNSPKHVRVLAVSRIGALIEALLAEGERQMKEIERATESVKVFTEGLSEYLAQKDLAQKEGSSP